MPYRLPNLINTENWVNQLVTDPLDLARFQRPDAILSWEDKGRGSI